MSLLFYNTPYLSAGKPIVLNLVVILMPELLGTLSVWLGCFGI